MCLIFIWLLRDFGALCGVGVFVYVDVDVDVIYKYLFPVCFLSWHNQKHTLFSMITYVLYQSCEIWALCSMDVCKFIIWFICNLSRCLISKGRSSIDQALIKTKHKVNWTVKVVNTRNSPPPSSYVHSFLSTTKHLEKIRLHMVFTLFVNILTNFFEPTKIQSFKQMSNLFLYWLLPQILTFTMPSLKLEFKYWL